MPGANLTRDEARARADVITVDSYDVVLDLTTSAQTFHSVTTLHFACSAPGASTFVDLIAPTVHEVVLNGKTLPVADVFDGVRLTLTGLTASNELRVIADCAYMNTGEGLHRFVDPVDGEVYLYSQFEVADSRRVFAVFEQPDLKATFTFTVTAPSHWQVFSVSPTPAPSPVREGVSMWRFAPTPILSSYVTAVVAGPYAGVASTVRSRKGDVPAGVYCRASLVDNLDADVIMTLTQQGFTFYEELFDYDYPFAKYDQIFVPEFNAGAMENAGCVTILEDYVFRSRVTTASIERRAITILHELAHMWFGDLVTMRWWDDLWLNESFAEYISHLACVEATEWTEAWTTFANVEKTWAYRQDQLPSTHPIVADISDLEDVEVNFDGITYAKGASVLRQLVAWVGQDAFTEGVRSYFRAHAWGNTTLRDLLSELERSSGRDLTEWSGLWLQTAGVGTLRPAVSVQDGHFTSFAVMQVAPDSWPTLRTHRLGIGLYDLRDGRLVRRDSLEVDIAGGRTEIPALVGVEQPDLVLLNDNDLAFVKIRLDERSVRTLIDHVGDIESALARALVWGAAWDMTRDAEMRARDYVSLALSGAGNETDSSVLRAVLRQTDVTVSLYVEPSHRDAAAALVSEGFEKLLAGAEPGSDAQLQLARAFASVARTDEQLSFVRDVYEGDRRIDGLTIDTDLRWVLLHALVSTGKLGDEAVTAELARDSTAAGERHAATARAARPTSAAKAEVWRAVVQGNDLPNSLQTAMIAGFASPSQRALLEAYVEPYFAAICDVWAERTNETAQNIVVGLYPTLLAGPELLARTDRWLTDNADAPAALRRLVGESRDGVARALRAQQADAAPSSAS